MIKRLIQIGNSRGIVIPSAMLKELGIKYHDELSVEVRFKKIVIRKVKKSNGRVEEK